MRKTACAIALLALAVSLARADDEASNTPLVTTSQSGGCYAKSVPAESYGSKGWTKVYAVQAGEDTLLQTYDWYSGRIFLQCGVGRPGRQIGTAVVRFGPWARGRRANANDLAMAFYFDGKLVKRYSTLDVAGSPDNVGGSVSHYRVIERVDGFRWQGSSFWSFDVVATGGRRLSFDPTTGEVLPHSPASQ